jgi:drug/metabolite transporter (DMT)-like permease
MENEQGYACPFVQGVRPATRRGSSSSITSGHHFYVSEPLSRSAMVLLLSLCAAVAYGLSDFVGGVVTRRASAWAVAATSQATAAVLTVGLAATNLGDPGAGDLWWGVLAGLGSGAGNVLIYRGLARGRMAVVAPLSAVAAAALPVLVGLSTGERPGVLTVIGVLTALPAIWLVSTSGKGLRHADRGDVAFGLLAGLGFGVQFSALGQVPDQAGLTPLAVSQIVSAMAIIGGAVAMSTPWMPRDRYSSLGAVAGLLAGIATICFQLAVQRGLLTIAGVVASMYPAVTVLLATVILREGIHRTQGAGLALATTAVVLIAWG